MMRLSLQPRTRSCSTYGSAARCITSARTMRENPAHEPATSASRRPVTPGPTKPATATMKLMPGIP